MSAATPTNFEIRMKLFENGIIAAYRRCHEDQVAIEITKKIILYFKKHKVIDILVIFVSVFELFVFFNNI